MKRIYLMIVTTLSLAGTAAVAAPPSLVPFKATYEVSRGVLSGESVVTLTDDGDGTWSYHSRLRTTGLAAILRNVIIDEYTEFRIERGRLVPLRHRYTIEGAGRRNRDFDIRFDWVARRVEGVVRGEPLSAEIEPGTVDRHAMVLAVMLDVAAGREYPRHYVMMDRGRIRHLDARIGEAATIETSVGALETTHVIQQRTDDPGRRYLTWLAPGLGHVPVRIQSVDDDGTDVTMTLTRLER